MNLGKVYPQLQSEFNRYKLQYPLIEHRTFKPCLKYNCHGMTFAARRTAITSSQEVLKILKDDGYQPVVLKDLTAGDIVVYWDSLDNGGEATHSGIVVDPDKHGLVKNPLIISKWGYCQEVVHRVNEGPYAEFRREYFRVVP